MKMPELIVFAKALAIGFIGAEVWRIAFYLGNNFAPTAQKTNIIIQFSILLIPSIICAAYALGRGVHIEAARIGRSFRIDLLLALIIGIWINDLASIWLTKLHLAFQSINPYWTPALLSLLCLTLLSPLIQHYWPRTRKTIPQLYFIADEEISDESDDVLASEVQAKSFAETVLASGAHPGLVFGVDGPWGVGKTSFINLAARHWACAVDKVIVCRFEPLRYASEPDLADRLIRDLSAAIQREVFAPEFRPAASRYSRLIKGKADISFLGFKLSVEPSQETVDELLDDIDEVLRRIGRRVIIVIDDLDRLDAKTTNSVLFATRRTFKLSQATYVLCYDTEILSGSQEENSRAREFLEKFVTVKLSLFVDSSGIRDFLKKDWEQKTNQFGSIPSDTMVNLSSVLNELANILDGDLAASYLPLVGNLRKVKRFVNAMLLMQLERSNLGRTDFNRKDLINLILLHLNYPGIFRLIYAEETEGRSGSFSLKRTYREPNFSNSAEFSNIVTKQPEPAAFLLKQLFDTETLNFPAQSDVKEAVLATRACFNQESFRNLENYLKLIVRFATPEPQQTFVLYHNAVERARNGTSIITILTSDDFQTEESQHAHDQFWRLLVNQSFDLTKTVADDAINTLVDHLPKYSSIADNDRSLRQRSIYSLVRLLDRAGWGGVKGKRISNTPENVVEIAWRIFGEHTYEGTGLIYRLASDTRGVLGWNDLMLFRLQCSADRNAQLHNLHSALIVHEDISAATTGWVDQLTIMGMRRLSQEIFKLFKRSYIDKNINFYTEANATPIESFIGEHLPSDFEDIREEHASRARSILVARSTLKSFVIYQLTNSNPPNGSGVGCGYYDLCGEEDKGGISRIMSEYLFGFCFNPNVDKDNPLHFMDYCLAKLNQSLSIDIDDITYAASRSGLTEGFNPIDMGKYWDLHQESIRERVKDEKNRLVITSSYTASYSEDLDSVFSVLDELADDFKKSDTTD
jgi:hypothetical protein